MSVTVKGTRLASGCGGGHCSDSRGRRFETLCSPPMHMAYIKASCTSPSSASHDCVHPWHECARERRSGKERKIHSVYLKINSSERTLQEDSTRQLLTVHQRWIRDDQARPQVLISLDSTRSIITETYVQPRLNSISRRDRDIVQGSELFLCSYRTW